MVDRLEELRAGCALEDLYESSISGDLESGSGSLDDSTQEALRAYNKESNALSEAIDRIHENIENINSRYQISVSESVDADADVRTQAANEGSHLLEATGKLAQAVRKRLVRIAAENKVFKRDEPGRTGELKVRVNTHQALTKRFMTAMGMFEESQEQHRDNVRSALERQLYRINPSATEEEIRDAVRLGRTDSIVEGSEALMAMDEAERAQLRSGLADLKSRNNDIKKLEQRIIELHTLFADMQIMVEAQGELLNNVEYNINETKGQTEAALQDLVEAREHQKSAHKKKACIVLLVLAILAAILVPTLLRVLPRGGADVVDAGAGAGAGGSDGSEASGSTGESSAGSSSGRSNRGGGNAGGSSGSSRWLYAQSTPRQYPTRAERTALQAQKMRPLDLWRA